MDDREREYQEYLTLRGHRHGDDLKNHTYGESEMRRIYREKAERLQKDREMQEYFVARQEREEGEDRERVRHFGRKKQAIAYNDSYDDGRAGSGRKKKKRKNKSHRIAAVITVLFLSAAVVAVGGGVFAFAALSSMHHEQIDENAIGINSEVATQLDGYQNIAILGIDARADEDDSEARSDAIIVASINKETSEVKMFSVYRDTLLNVGDQGLDKIAHAYFYGGAQQSLCALNRNLDLNIDRTVVINWKTVADMIDAVGGIDIVVQESEIDEMNKFIPETAKNVDGPDDKIKNAGKQTLNGVQAVTYSRIRKDALTGDYRRNERMKIVFSQTFKKVKSSGPLTIFKVATDIMPEIRTNFSTMEIVKILARFKAYDMTDDTTGFPYDVGSWTGYGGAGYAWYGPPVSLTNNVSKLHEKFFNQGGYTPTDTVQEISYAISALTGLY